VKKNEGSFPPLTKGQLNKIIDTLIHPYFKKHPFFVVIDGILHAMVEQNPEESIKKFIKYNLDKFVESCARCLNVR